MFRAYPLLTAALLLTSSTALADTATTTSTEGAGAASAATAASTLYSPYRKGRPSLTLHSSEDTDLQVTFSAQLQAEHDSDRDERVRVRLRRVRPGLKLSLLDGAVKGRLQLNISPGVTELLDVWTDLSLASVAPGLSLRVGQFKAPFLRYRMGAVYDLMFVDWSTITPYIGGERQIGLMLGKSAPKRGGVEAQLGVFHGQNARKSHGVGPALLYKAKRENPSALSDPGKLGDVHPEVVAHAAVHVGPTRARVHSDDTGGPLRWTGDVSLAWDAKPTDAQDYRWRAGVESTLKARGASWSVVGFAGGVDLITRDASNTLATYGALTELGYRPGASWGAAARASHMRVAQEVREDIAAVFTAAGTSDLPLQIQDELGVALNYYAWHELIRVQLDAALIRDTFDTSTDPGREDVTTQWQVRTQLLLRM